MPKTYQCVCGATHTFSAWVFAHWSDTIVHLCAGCGRKNELYQGRVRFWGKPRPSDTWKILVQ